MTLAERLHVSEGLKSDIRVWRPRPFAIEAKAMWLTRIRQHLNLLPEGAQFRNQHFPVEAIDRLYITLNNQDRALDSAELGTRQLLELRCVVALWIL